MLARREQQVKRSFTDDALGGSVAIDLTQRSGRVNKRRATERSAGTTSPAAGNAILRGDVAVR